MAALAPLDSPVGIGLKPGDLARRCRGPGGQGKFVDEDLRTKIGGQRLADEDLLTKIRRQKFAMKNFLQYEDLR